MYAIHIVLYFVDLLIPFILKNGKDAHVKCETAKNKTIK